MVEHMVWIRFHEGVAPERIARHMAGLRDLKEKVPGILALKAGENFCPRSGGFTHGLSVTFPSRDALKLYADHPEHVAVAAPLRQDAELRAMDFEF